MGPNWLPEIKPPSNGTIAMFAILFYAGLFALFGWLLYAIVLIIKTLL